MSAPVQNVIPMQRYLRGAETLKLLLWTSIPTHHQSAFLAALRAQGIDLAVHYYRRVGEHRLQLGWNAPDELPEGERYVKPSLTSMELCSDWTQRIHIVPGYSKPFLIRLAMLLSDRRVPWLHWSEPSQPSFKSFFTFPVKRFYGALVDRHAIGALAIGDRARNDFVRWGVRADKIRFLPYAVAGVRAGEAQHSAPEPCTGSVRFLFVGALCPRKGVDVLLKAFHSVVSAHPGARLELTGHDRSRGGYWRLAQELQIAHAVKFSPAIPAERIGSAFSRCDVFVLPSRFDGWGVVLNEAASMGRALISTESTGAAHHLIVPGTNGFRVPPNDPHPLANAMLAYCREPQLAATHGRHSSMIFTQFTPERNAVRLLEALESLHAAGYTQRNRTRPLRRTSS